eukprot:1158255-Prorocentrum_minimum.AAC.3
MRRRGTVSSCAPRHCLHTLRNTCETFGDHPACVNISVSRCGGKSAHPLCTGCSAPPPPARCCFFEGSEPTLREERLSPAPLV